MSSYFAQNHPSEEQVKSKNLKSLIRKTLKIVEKFKPQHEYRDRVWKFYLKVSGKWCLFGARRDQELFIIFCGKFKTLVFDVEKDQLMEADQYSKYEKLLPPLLGELETFYKKLKNNPIKTNCDLMKKISPAMREGLIHRSHVRKIIPDWNRYDKELGVKNVEAMIKFIEDYRKEKTLKKMTAEKYFEYCKIAYLANSGVKRFGLLDTTMKVDPSMSGREMFRRYADGRDGGLKEIKQKSEQAFIDWFEKKDGKGYMGFSGDHPWEIYRGGNTTHIDLRVEKYYNNEWKITLSAYSSTRLAETCRIALALHKAGLPFELNHEKSYLKRLLCDDFIGIIPEHDSVHRGWQRFPEDFCVADVIQFSWFKDERTNKWLKPPRDIVPLIHWLPEEPAVLRD